MKLYAFYPSGHGQYSFFVCANNKDEAFQKVDKHIKNKHTGNEYDPGVLDYVAEGWGTDYYVIVESDGVLENDND